jgi:alanine racemase
VSTPQNNSAEGYTGPLGHLEVHLDRIRWNYLSLQKRLGKGADCAAVVKADAYGIGAAEVVAELYKANCRQFYVAHLNEGVIANKALDGQRASIYVLHGPCGASADEFSRNNLIPVLNSLGDVEYWAGCAKKSGRRLPAILQLDTGMNRLGLTANEVTRLKDSPETLKVLDVRYILSHLACADEPDHPKNRQQLEKFKTLSRQLGLPCPLSFANSAGIFLGADYHFDQVRPGAALYGINPLGTVSNQMHGVITFKARILQIKDVDSGETVGYGAEYQVPTAAKLAIVSVGYADGYLRCLTGSGMVFIGGQKCPVVGRVSMDLIAVDVTQMTPLPRAGDWAEIIGENQTVDDLARAAKTIGYEILTNLGRRYKRIYTGQE